MPDRPSRAKGPRQETPLARADLELLAEEWGVRIDDLWPALNAERIAEADALDETA